MRGYAWVEVNGRLIEVEATQRIRIDEQEKLVPLSELDKTASALKVLKGMSDISAQAAISKAEADFETMTGISWRKGQRLRGTPKKATGTVLHEGRVAKGQRDKKKA